MSENKNIVHCCLFELYHEFIFIFRNLDYNKDCNKGITEVVKHSFNTNLEE